MHGAGGEDRNDQNLEMLMIYDNSRQVWTQVRHGDLIMNIEDY